MSLTTGAPTPRDQKLYSLPSGFWPPLPSSQTRGATISHNPNVLGATAITTEEGNTGSGENRNAGLPLQMHSIDEEAVLAEVSQRLGSTTGTASSGISPHLRQRARHIMDTRRITSPITRYSDVVWQENPSRVLKYRASILHTYGWAPFFIWRNVKATVFGNPRLYLQTSLLLLWMLILHLTGLGAMNRDIQVFTTIFGTSYLGAVFNVGTVVVFILGLFVTLVINRWWSMRAVYAKLASNTVDVVTVITTVIRNPGNSSCYHAQRARTELVRFLNLGHLLVLTQADGQSRHFYRSPRLEELYGGTIGRVLRWLWPHQRSNTEEDPKLNNTWQKAVRDIGFLDLNAEGLVNVDEWKHIVDSEQRGMPRYILAYHWAQALLHELQTVGWIQNSAQSLPTMLNKISSIVDAGAQIFTYINSQLPYPYVHLVSFVVHSYVWILATYLGLLLNGGLNEARGFVSANFNGTDADYKTLKMTLDGIRDGHIVADSIHSVLVSPQEDIHMFPFTAVFMYYFIVLANVTFQGLLDMHTLLDNPFGRHCAKFPLRAQITELMNTCRALLQTSEMVPDSFADIFEFEATVQKSGDSNGEGATLETPAGHVARMPHRRQDSADFLYPKGLPVGNEHSRSGVSFSRMRPYRTEAFFRRNPFQPNRAGTSAHPVHLDPHQERATAHNAPSHACFDTQRGDGPGMGQGSRAQEPSSAPASGRTSPVTGLQEPRSVSGLENVLLDPANNA
mmetsp:Transcript_4602/g.11151  ORF Transcript_4602/g.11151 Transcript_4602/m.11151 type:complete len:735 (+) Transcript_4602:197-2401(+)